MYRTKTEILKRLRKLDSEEQLIGSYHVKSVPFSMCWRWSVGELIDALKDLPKSEKVQVLYMSERSL